MIRLAICDDEQQQIDEINILLSQFMDEHPEVSLSIVSFSNPHDLLNHIQTKNGFDLYLLDIVMPGITGIDCAARIRMLNDNCEIIFLTTSREYGVEAFEVKATDYLIKPIQKQRLFDSLLLAAKKHNISRSPVIVKILSNGSHSAISQTVEVDDIVCIESFNYYREVRLKNGEILKTKSTLSEWKNLFNAYPEFFMPNKSYLINFNYVKGMKKNELYVASYVIPVAREKKKKTQDLYLEYITNNKRM